MVVAIGTVSPAAKDTEHSIGTLDHFAWMPQEVNKWLVSGL